MEQNNVNGPLISSELLGIIFFGLVIAYLVRFVFF
jgi:hypothetical protein